MKQKDVLDYFGNRQTYIGHLFDPPISRQSVIFWGKSKEGIVPLDRALTLKKQFPGIPLRPNDYTCDEDLRDMLKVKYLDK